MAGRLPDEARPAPSSLISSRPTHRPGDDGCEFRSAGALGGRRGAGKPAMRPAAFDAAEPARQWPWNRQRPKRSTSTPSAMSAVARHDSSRSAASGARRKYRAGNDRMLGEAERPLRAGCRNLRCARREVGFVEARRGIASTRAGTRACLRSNAARRATREEPARSLSQGRAMREADGCEIRARGRARSCRRARRARKAAGRTMRSIMSAIHSSTNVCCPALPLPGGPAAAHIALRRTHHHRRSKTLPDRPPLPPTSKPRPPLPCARVGPRSR